MPKKNSDNEDKTTDYQKAEYLDLAQEIKEMALKKFGTTELQGKYVEARYLFEQKKFINAADACKKIIKQLMTEFIETNYLQLSRTKKFSDSFKILLPKEEEELILENIDMIKLAKIFDDPEINVFHVVGGRYEELSALLNSFDYENLILLTNSFGASEEDQGVIELSVQQMLSVIIIFLLAREDIEIAPYHLLANYTDMTRELLKIKETITKLSDVESPLTYLEPIKKHRGIRNFEWVKQEGMLINPSDSSRNIAFKVQTLINLLSDIYEGIVKFASPLDKDSYKTSIELADNIIFNAGYHCGSDFGWAVVELFQKDGRRKDLETQIINWCAFDSDVGFGLLELNGSIKKQEKKTNEQVYHELHMQIKLLNNFLVYKKDATDINLCSFMKGYIQGVLEKITGQPLKVEHPRNQCEQFIPQLDHCMFNVSTNTDKIIPLINAATSSQKQNISQVEIIK